MSKPPPPPLPPRQSSSSVPPSSPTPDEAPPAYTDIATEDTLTLHHPSLDGTDTDAGPWQHSADPRSSSTQSLVPSELASHDSRRRLLLIFIHGFMGDETSFRSFPAHLHRLLTVLVAETHTVHTKIYPRYRSKRNIAFARDDFSRWLEPHEDESTDVVLFGHSMGGLLAAEVVLLPPPPPASRPFKHRILGTINFDVPFLGMHPGVVRSGLASIFKPAEDPEDKYSPGTSPGLAADGSSSSGPMRADTLWDPGNDDPNFNPQFNNDVVLPVRKGWRNAWHFVNKHSGNLRTATKQLVTNHMEFGGAMANYGELKVRYSRVRALEEENQMVRDSVGRGKKGVPRVRFTNYYTASSGRAKPKKEMKSPKSEAKDVVEGPGEALVTPTSLERDDEENGKQDGLRSEGLKVEKSPSPKISVEEHRDDGEVLRKDAEQASEARTVDESHLSEEDDEWQDAAESLTLHSPPSAGRRRSSTNGASGASLSPQSTRKSSHRLSSKDGGEKGGSEISSLPPLPEPPNAPPPLDLTFIQDAETRKRVEKEHSRAMKSYEKAVKEREKVVASRAKWQAKREKSTQKDADRAEKEAEKAKKRSEKEEEKRKKKEAGKGKGTKKVQKPESEMTHQEKEERRLAAERLRMENEGRRMRGEPPLPEEGEEEQEADEEQPLTVPDQVEQDGTKDPSSPPRTPSSSSSELPIVDNAPSPIPLAPSPVISHGSDQNGIHDVASGDNQQKGKMGEIHLPEPAALPPASPPLPPREPSLAPSATTTTTTTTTTTSTADDEKKQPQKEHKFCLLPPKDSKGDRDPAWVRVWMEGVDEVGAHCGLFFVDERYERLVGDVGERVEGWVRENYGGGIGDGGGGFGDEKRG
ncbi:hypothetical protein D0865_02870 [Hortaea werneckii]|uniref:AB hydrolase-1 domain-containing protein n=1 Tax=Hortaea werneckii TaxID=91943 RepID=A0A3M7D1V0_HORWE|nr:hypothetical protein D0865_02870 [Hortaea werneckii]